MMITDMAASNINIFYGKSTWMSAFSGTYWWCWIPAWLVVISVHISTVSVIGTFVVAAVLGLTRALGHAREF